MCCVNVRICLKLKKTLVCATALDRRLAVLGFFCNLEKHHHFAGLVLAGVNAKSGSVNQNLTVSKSRQPTYRRWNGKWLLFQSYAASSARRTEVRGGYETSPAKLGVEIQVRLCTAWFKSSALPQFGVSSQSEFRQHCHEATIMRDALDISRKCVEFGVEYRRRSSIFP